MTLCADQDPLAYFKRLQMGIFRYSQKVTGAKSVAMATTVGVILVSFVMYIAGAKFEEHFFIVSTVILD